MKQIVHPIKIVEKQGVEQAENLLKRQPLQIGLDERYLTKFSEGDFVVLDFGKEMNGGVRILTHGTEQGEIRIRFGESLSECYSNVTGEREYGVATNDHAFRDFNTGLLRYSDLTFANTGYRFVRIDMIKGKATIKSIVGTNHILLKKSKWGYQGCDKQIKAIYETAKRTVDLCAGGDFIWDGIKRDRLVWIGDMHPEMLAYTAMYGTLKKLEVSLDFVKTQTPLPNWMNRYPTYSMWWIIIIADYYEKTRCTAFAKKQIPYMQDLLKQMSACVEKDGNLNYPAYFVDWPTVGKEDEVMGVRAINITACKKAIALLKYFGAETAVVEEMLTKLLKKDIVATSKQVLGLKYFAVGLTEEDKKKLVECGAKGMSTFMSYYILKAVASFDKAKAIEMMKEYYGGMLKKGATTFWEDFDLEWTKKSNDLIRLPKDDEKDIHGDFGNYCYKGFRHSLCHGWSAGVIAFIKEEC